jgi:hypothetical protein
MASLIPGYECDNFIFYRQKENKHECWVTEFAYNQNNHQKPLLLHLQNHPPYSEHQLLQ